MIALTIRMVRILDRDERNLMEAVVTLIWVREAMQDEAAIVRSIKGDVETIEVISITAIIPATPKRPMDEMEVATDTTTGVRLEEVTDRIRIITTMGTEEFIWERKCQFQPTP